MKFSNFTQQNCSGTTGDLTLGTAISGRLTFAQSDYSDGDLFPFTLEGNGGELLESIGRYNTGGTVTRYDIEYWDGTTLTKNIHPGETTLTLPSGDHVITVGMGARLAHAVSDNHVGQDDAYNGFLVSGTGGASSTYTADTQYGFAFRLEETNIFTALAVYVNTAQSGASAEIGLTRLVNGIPDDTYIISGSIDVTTTGSKSVALNKMLLAGDYVAHYVCTDGGVALGTSGKSIGSGAVVWTPLDETQFTNRSSPTGGLGKSGVTGGTLDAAPETVTGGNFIGVNESIPYFILGKA